MAVKKGWTGRVFEDFEVGDVYEHPLGRTVIAADNVWFTCLTMNTNPIHFDTEYASATEFKRPLVNSCFTLALVTGQSVTDLTVNAVANLGWDDVRLPHPLFEGDTVRSKSEVLETRESKSRPNVGIVRVKTTGMNQDGEAVIEFTRTFMIWKRGHVPAKVQPEGGNSRICRHLLAFMRSFSIRGTLTSSSSSMLLSRPSARSAADSVSARHEHAMNFASSSVSLAGCSG